MSGAETLNITDCINMFLENRTWKEREVDYTFYALFETWFNSLENKEEKQKLYKCAAKNSNEHDFQKVCSILYEELKSQSRERELPLVFQQFVECLERLLKVSYGAQIHQGDNPLRHAMRKHLTQCNVAFWGDTPGVYGVFPLQGGDPSAKDVQKVTATVVPLDTKEAGKIIAGNFTPDDAACQKALEFAHQVVANALHIKKPWVLGEAIWWMLVKMLVSWGKTRLLQRHDFRWDWGAILSHSLIYIHLENGAMGPVQGPSIALPAALAILLALPRGMRASQHETFPPLPYQCRHLSRKSVSYAYTGAFASPTGDLDRVGNIQEKKQAISHFNKEKKSEEAIKILICPEQNCLDNHADMESNDAISVPCQGFKNLQVILNYLMPVRSRWLWILPCNIIFIIVFLHLVFGSLGLFLWDQCFSKPTPRFDTYQCSNCWAGVDEDPGVVSLKTDREGILQLHISETTVQRYHRQNQSDYLLPYYLLSRKDAPLTVTIIVDKGGLTSLLSPYSEQRFKEFDINIENNGWINFTYVFTGKHINDNGYIFIKNRKGEKLKQYVLYVKREM